MLGEHFTLLGDHFTLLGDHFTLLGDHLTLSGDHLTMFDKHVLLLGTGGGLFFNQGKQPGVPVVGYAAKVMKILRQGRQIDIKHIDLPTQLFNP